MTPVGFVQGAVAMGCTISGVFFLRFWHQSRDRLFAHFAMAFWILATSYLVLGLNAIATDWQVYVFLLRLVAFCLILYGVLDKNRT